MTPKLIRLLMIFVCLVGFKSVREVIRRKENIVMDLLIFMISLMLLIEYVMVLPVLG